MKLEELCKKIKVVAKLGETKNQKPEGFQLESDGFRVTLKYQGRQMSLDFYQGYGWRAETPPAERVMSCLLADYPAVDMTFSEFCSEFGYDEDSRKAEETYNHCLEQGKKLEKLLGDDLMEFVAAEE